ncbi:MAG: TRAP transporter large permease [Dehalococcoidales bacterium]|nr:TRAP transporter large permease [Dehalococcoidales bacterium]
MSKSNGESDGEMSPATIGFIGIIVLILLFVLGMPIGFAMALVGVLGFGYLVSVPAGLSLLARDVYDNFSSYSLTVIPMFILMGSIAFAAGMSRRLYDASHTIFGQMRGGLLFATVAGCAGFAAICGSTSATAAAMGRVALPEMKRFKYNDAIATGCVAAAGSLGILIPPSTIFMVYGILTQQSIGKLFISGVLPGILLAGLFMLTIFIICRRYPDFAPPGKPTTYAEKIAGLAGVGEMFLLFGLVMGGLFLGWFSPMQAGAAGAFLALIIGMARGKMSWGGMRFAINDTLKVTGEVMIIVTGAVIFGHFIAVTKIPMSLTSWAAGLAIPPNAVMGILILIYFIGGFFMDALAMITLTIPIVYPLVVSLGFNPIWFGVIIVLVTEMGVVTPPVGINVFVIKSIAEDVPMETIFKGVFPFVGAMLVATALLIAFPWIATFLPGLVTY